jgi:hypothetical protein
MQGIISFFRFYLPNIFQVKKLLQHRDATVGLNATDRGLADIFLAYQKDVVDKATKDHTISAEELQLIIKLSTLNCKQALDFEKFCNEKYFHTITYANKGTQTT